MKQKNYSTSSSSHNRKPPRACCVKPSVLSSTTSFFKVSVNEVAVRVIADILAIVMLGIIYSFFIVVSEL